MESLITNYLTAGLFVILIKSEDVYDNLLECKNSPEAFSFLATFVSIMLISWPFIMWRWCSE